MKALKKMQTRMNSRSGVLLIRNVRWAKWGFILFTLVLMIATGLQLAEIGPPGMAWYVYQ